ncbi:EAL domain-containing protein [Alteromonas pelagimontana]|uniref:EAL domain-containing protein n=1 Tax=Alteromonas pelagimontana TaxID=1858656 RepID=A0A6M4M9N6_9ALTE|nr:EAL domain-containing protein [Alteromonas pelagimontana]QJR79862.1 EAL domain-containing protein [Alteromonas pelagimontana]
MRSSIARSVLCTLILCGILFCSDSVAVSITDIHFSELNQRDGLSDSTVLDIAEGNRGYIWVATLNGLNRYSGSEFKQYHPSDVDPHSIPSGFIRKLFVDSHGTLWIGTFNGLAKYVPENDNFIVFNKSNSGLQSNNISFIGESSDGNLLIGNGQSLHFLDLEKDTVSILSSKLTFSSDITVLRDEPSRIWIGTYQNGMYIFNKSDKRLYTTQKVNPWGMSIPSTNIFDLQIIEGEYWVSTEKGIFRLTNSGEISGLINQKIYPELSSDQIFSITEVDNAVWLGTQKGLSIFDLQSGRFVTLGPESSVLTGLTEKNILQIFEDSTEGVWVGTYGGLFRYHPEVNTIKLFRNKREFQKKQDGNTVWGLAEDNNGFLWFVTQNEGIGKFDLETGKINYFLSESSETFWDLAIDEFSHFWVATSNGLEVYSFEEGKMVKLATLFEGTFIDTFFYNEGRIWLNLAHQKLVAVDTALLTLYLQGTSPDQLIENIDLKIETNDLVPMYWDSEKRLWLSGEDGIFIYSYAKEKIVKVIDVEDGVRSRPLQVYEWSNFYWVTTRSNGVLQIDAKTLELRRSQASAVEGGMIFSSIGLDDSIWYANHLGLHRVDLASLAVTESLTSPQLNFNVLNESAVVKTSTGALVFGGNEGFNILTKDAIEQRVETQKTRAPELIDFKIFGVTANSDDENIPQSFAIAFNDKISLNHDQSRFSISYSLINPLIPSAVDYRYRMQGYDKEWFSAQNVNTAQYNNLPFGKYTFEVQAKEDGKEWSNSKQIPIEIGRPPWLHSSALIFYTLILAGVLLLLVRQYQIRKYNQTAIRESEERLKLTLWSSGDELWDWDVYRSQVYRSNTWGTLDFPQDNIRTTSAYDANIHPNDILRVQEALKAHLEERTEYYELAYRAKTFNNKWIWILDRGKVVTRDHNNQPVRMTGTLKDIHHLKEAEEQLNLFKRSIETISEGVFITNTNFKFISVNNAYCNYTGETRDQALATYMYFHQYPDAFTEEIKKTLRTRGNWFGEVESVRVNGERYEMELNIDAVHDEDGRISHFVGVFSDITARKGTEKELLKLANTDPLTDLPNRSFFQASHQNLVRKSEPHALLCLDMDNFKKINDSLGHQTGDVLIKQIAKRLQRITGNDATCYRLGGDEFSVLMEDHSDIHTITHYAQNVLDTLSRPFIINKQEFVLGASIGIAFYPDDGTTPQEMLKNADTAMYFAKNNGGNSYKFFSGEMNQNAVRQLQIENLIRQGIKDDLFTVYYQPKVDIASGKLVSMEALVRFEHPHKGIVSPGQFIPLAEQTGQIIEIGEQVLRKACADTKRWVNEGIFSGRVAVNISVKQFELPDLDDRIDKVLNEVGLSPLHLECEITEGTLMENPEQGLRMMERLRERGIHLALDDFGTGYSSLAYLKRFPLNTLKIDKAFIDDIAESSVDRHMTAAIINIAHNLGLKVVAEGVEHEKQLTILRRYECEMLQGYLYSKPLNAERFEKLLRENQKLHHLIGQHSL